MSEGPVDQGESLEDIATFLSGVEAFRTLGRDQLGRVAASVTHRGLRAGEAMIVEGGPPSTQLWVLRDGALDLLRRDHLVTVMTTGELLGYASLLTRTAPAFSVRARVDRTLSFRGGLLGGRARRGGSQGVLHAAGSVGRRLTSAPLTRPSNCSAYSTPPASVS